MVRAFRTADDATPLVLMGYYNRSMSTASTAFSATPNPPASTG
jgi:tryptophan synthase alpha subunit